MPFWNRQKKEGRQPITTDAGQVQKSKRTARRSPPVALEVKLLALEALESGLAPSDLTELVGVTETTLATDAHPEGWIAELEKGAPGGRSGPGLGTLFVVRGTEVTAGGLWHEDRALHLAAFPSG